MYATGRLRDIHPLHGSGWQVWLVLLRCRKKVGLPLTEMGDERCRQGHQELRSVSLRSDLGGGVQWAAGRYSYSSEAGA